MTSISPLENNNNNTYVEQEQKQQVSIYNNPHLRSRANNDNKSQSKSAVDELSNFVKENNIPLNIIKAKAKKDVPSVKCLDCGTCGMILSELLACKKLEDLIKTKCSLSPKELLSCDSIYSLGKKDCEFYIRIIEKSANQKDADSNVQKEFYCKLLDIKSGDIKSNSVEHFILGAKEALKESQVNDGNINKASAKKLALDYMTALDYDWDSIEDFKNWNKDKTTLRQRLVQAKCLKQKDKYGNLEIIEATRKYFDKVLPGLYESKLKTEKPKTKEDLQRIKDWYQKLYNQTLGKLLINTPDKDKRELLYGATKTSLLERGMLGCKEEYISSQSNMFEHIVAYMSDEERKELVKNCFENFDFIVQGNFDTNDVTKLAKVLAGELSPKELESYSFKQVEKLKQTEQKRKEAEEQLQQKPNDKQAQETYDNAKQEYDIQVAQRAGINFAVAGRNDMSIADKEEHLKNIDAQCSTETRKQVYIVQKHYLEQDSELPSEDKEKIISLFNTVSYGNFGLIMQDENAELKPIERPENISKTSDLSENNIGLPQKTENVTSNLEAAKQLAATIEQQSSPEDNSYAVIKEKSPSPILNIVHTEDVPHEDSTPNLFLSLKNIKALNISDIIENSIGVNTLIKQYSDLKLSVQKHINYMLSSESETEQVFSINMMDNHTDMVHVANEIAMSEEGMQKLDLDSYTRKQLKRNEEVA